MVTVTSAVCVSFVLVWYIMIRNSSPTTSQRIMWFLTASCLSYIFSLRCYLYMSMEMCPSNISEYIYVPPPSPPGHHVCIQNTTDTPQSRTPNPGPRDTKLSFLSTSKDTLEKPSWAMPLFKADCILNFWNRCAHDTADMTWTRWQIEENWNASRADGITVPYIYSPH